MKRTLYLIRHGIATKRHQDLADEQRPLTSQGRLKTQQVAQRLCQLDLHFDLILTSPLVRARQTAEILQAAGLSTQVNLSSTLAPLGDFNQWLRWLNSWQDSGGNSLALVGHQPDLSQWAERLVWGQPKEVLELKKAGVMGLTLPKTGSAAGNSQLFWLTPPKLL